METSTQLQSGQQWTSAQKIAFRFFFVFLSLQILTENYWCFFFGIWDHKLFNLIAGVFVQPCLWLNDHFFHFKYIPSIYTPFTGSLHTIRDLVYLFTTLISSVIWSIWDSRRPSYNRLLYWFSLCLILVLSTLTFSYGITKLFPVQMKSPSFLDLQKRVGELSPWRLIWTAFGYGRPYQMFCGLFEVMGAVLILFRKTRVTGLLVIASLMINIIIINYTFSVGVLVTAFCMFLMSLFLLAPYAPALFRIFLKGQTAALTYSGYNPSKTPVTKWFNRTGALLICISFACNIWSVYLLYVRAETTNKSREYSLVRNFIMERDTLNAVENDSVRWRIWSERKTDGKSWVTVSTMKPGVDKNYRLERDSAGRVLTLTPVGQKDSTSLRFKYTRMDSVNWVLEGVISQKNVKIECQKINPDTIVDLLKTKRAILRFEDTPDD